MSQGIEMKDDYFSFSQLKKDTQAIAYVGMSVYQYLLFDHNKKELPMPDLLYQEKAIKRFLFFCN